MRFFPRHCLLAAFAVFLPVSTVVALEVDPILLWSFEQFQTMEPRVLDESGNAHHGTFSGGTAAQTLHGPVGDSYLSPNNTLLAAANSTGAGLGLSGDYTFSVWFQGYAATTNGVVGGAYGDGAVPGFGLFFLGGTQKLAYYHVESTSPFRYNGVTSTESYAEGWHHAAAVFKKGVGSTLYVDGIAVGTGTSCSWGLPSLPKPFTVGGQDYSSPRYYQGGIDQVMLFDEALSAAQIAELFAQGEDPGDPIDPPDPPNTIFSKLYSVSAGNYCLAGTCVDYNGDGRKQLLFNSRSNNLLEMRNADDGSIIWSKPFAGENQSLMASDVDQDGDFEILYTVSSPGRLYLMDHNGNTIDYWDSGDSKLGNSPVIIDGDGDGALDGYFGSRNSYLLRIGFEDPGNIQELDRRSPWSQCGCHTSAKDVDNDGKWDLFAGTGDDGGSNNGVLHRYDPVDLSTVWSYPTNDNASSADAVLVDIDGDGQVEIIKSVDNYAGDDAHDAIHAFKVDGTHLWSRPGFSGEDSPNVADLEGDGEIEIIGMTFGNAVYCLNADGSVRWQVDLRPELTDAAHAYMTPILVDLDGEKGLEILAMTNGGYSGTLGHGKVFALDVEGNVLAEYDVGGNRYWGEAFVANVDDDPFLEIVLSGNGGYDVIKTKGYGPDVEYFQRRRSYTRNNVIPWAYEDDYFVDRGRRVNVENETDDLVLAKLANGDYAAQGVFMTDILVLPTEEFRFTTLEYQTETPAGTSVTVNVLDDSGQVVLTNVASGAHLELAHAVRLQFILATTDGGLTPHLDFYSLAFDKIPPLEGDLNGDGFQSPGVCSSHSPGSEDFGCLRRIVCMSLSTRTPSNQS